MDLLLPANFSTSEEEVDILDVLSKLESYTLVSHALNITSREIWTPTFQISPVSQTSFVRQYIPIFVRCIQQYGYIIIRNAKNGLDVVEPSMANLMMAKLPTQTVSNPVGKLSECKQFYVLDKMISKEDMKKCKYYVYVLDRPAFDRNGRMVHPTSAGYIAIRSVIDYETRKRHDRTRDENNSKHGFFTIAKNLNDSGYQDILEETSAKEDQLVDQLTNTMELGAKVAAVEIQNANNMGAVEFPFRNCDARQTSYQARPQDWSQQMATIAQTVAQNYRMPKSYAAGMQPVSIGGMAKQLDNDMLQWSRFITDVRLICIELFEMFNIEITLVTHVQPEQLPHILSVVGPEFGKQMFADAYGIDVDKIDSERYDAYVQAIMPTTTVSSQNNKRRNHSDDVSEDERKSKIAHVDSASDKNNITDTSTPNNGS